MEDRKGTTLQDLSALRIDAKARPNAKRGRRKGFVIAAIVVAIVLCLSALTLKGRHVKVEVATARNTVQGKGAVVLNASGYVTPRRRATIAAKITGRVTEMLVDEGMYIGENQVIARLDDAEAKARVASAKTDHDVACAYIAELEVNLADANRTLNRTLTLRRDGVASQQDLDRAQAAADALKARIELTKEQVRAAQAKLEVAQRDLDNCTVRSPFSGITVSKDAQVGEVVSPVSAGGGFTRTGIATIVDMKSLETEVDVNESYIAKVSTGQKVEATLDAYPDWQIPCTVRTIIPTADRQKATIKVRISFDALDPRILPDMGVKVSFLNSEETPQTGQGRALIPKQAVREAEGKQVVFLLQKDRLEKRTVKVGPPRGNDVEVLEGVSPGERVVIGGDQDLRDGQRAEIK